MQTTDLVSRTWMQDAVCRTVDPRVFFPSRGDRPALAEALAYCVRCPVRWECLAYRMVTEASHGDAGIWGGASALTRKRVARQLALNRSLADIRDDDVGRFIERLRAYLGDEVGDELAS